MTLIPLAILFLPIVIGAGAIFPWVHPSEHMAELIANKRGYLSVGWFTARAVIYFTIWIGLAVLFDRLSSAEDRTDDPWPTIWMQRLSGPGLVLLFLTASFAAIDWGMSLEPEWYSTMFPPLMIVGWGLTTFAVMIIVVALLAPFEPVPEVVTPSRLNDLGNLMLTFVMLWAYMSFSQYLIIWAGQMLEEQPWYLRRTFGAWGRVGQALILFHFIVPFVLLLFRESKRKRHFLMGIAALIALMHVVDLAWVVFPAQVEDPLATHFTWYSAAALPFALLGVGGIWLACFLWFLKGIGLLPAHLPAGIETAAEGPAPAAAPAPGGP